MPDTIIDMRTMPAHHRVSKPGTMQIVTINLPRGMVDEIEKIVRSRDYAPSRSELVRQFIREGLERHEKREARRRALGLL
jgi:metal-responsive CopG/Arc/MetJ family transcriptional regulator